MSSSVAVMISPSLSTRPSYGKVGGHLPAAKVRAARMAAALKEIAALLVAFCAVRWRRGGAAGFDRSRYILGIILALRRRRRESCIFIEHSS